MDTAELRSKDDQELRFDQRKLEKELFDLRFKSTAEEVTQPSRIRQIRRQIARIKTVLRERELGVRGQGQR